MKNCTYLCAFLALLLFGCEKESLNEIPNLIDSNEESLNRRGSKIQNENLTIQEVLDYYKSNNTDVQNNNLEEILDWTNSTELREFNGKSIVAVPFKANGHFIVFSKKKRVVKYSLMYNLNQEVKDFKKGSFFILNSEKSVNSFNKSTIEKLNKDIAEFELSNGSELNRNDPDNCSCGKSWLRSKLQALMDWFSSNFSGTDGGQSAGGGEFQGSSSTNFNYSEFTYSTQGGFSGGGGSGYYSIHYYNGQPSVNYYSGGGGPGGAIGFYEYEFIAALSVVPYLNANQKESKSTYLIDNGSDAVMIKLYIEDNNYSSESIEAINLYLEYTLNDANFAALNISLFNSEFANCPSCFIEFIALYNAMKANFSTWVSSQNWPFYKQVLESIMTEVLLGVIPASDVIDIVEGIQHGDILQVSLGTVATIIDVVNPSKKVRVIGEFAGNVSKLPKIIRHYDDFKAINASAFNRMPTTWPVDLADTEKGIKWTRNAFDEIRIMKADLSSPRNYHHVEYARLKKNGNFLGKDGKFYQKGSISNDKFQELTHIPLSHLNNSLLDIYFN